MLRGIVADGVFMAAQNIHGIAADAQARTGHQPPVDGVAHRGIGRSRAFRAHIALGREPGHQIGFGGQHRQDGPLRHGFLHRLQILRAGMQK